MADFLSVQNGLNGGNAIRPAPPAPVQAVPAVGKTNSSGVDPDLAGHRHPSDSRAHSHLASPAAPDPEKVLTGPPPAFEATLLEIEARLEAVIKRMEADRERARQSASGAIAPAHQSQDKAQSSDDDGYPGKTTAAGHAAPDNIPQPTGGRSDQSPAKPD